MYVERNRSPYKTLDSDKNDQECETKSKSLPPSRALGDSRRSNSRGAASQSRDIDHKDKDGRAHRQETAEEREEREFNERLKHAETQEDKERLLARRQKFMKTVQPIEPTKKVISLKSKMDYSIDDEPLNEKRLRRKNEEIIGATERKGNEGKIDGQSTSLKGRVTKTERLASEEVGDSILLGVEDTHNMFDDKSTSKMSNKLRGAYNWSLT